MTAPPRAERHFFLFIMNMLAPRNASPPLPPTYAHKEASGLRWATSRQDCEATHQIVQRRL